MNASRTPRKGDEVWLSDGSRAIYIDQTSRGAHLVHPVFESEDGEPWESTDISTVGEVHLAEPIPALSAEVKALREQHDKLAAAIEEARKSKYSTEIETRRMLESLKRFEPFAQIEMIMDGRATHAGRCGPNDGIQIMALIAIEKLTYGDGWAAADSVTFEASYKQPGKPSGAASLRARRDYGRSADTFFESEESAMEWGRSKLPALVEAFRSMKNGSEYEFDNRANAIIASCHLLGIEVPEDIRRYRFERDLKSARATREKAEQEVARYAAVEARAAERLAALADAVTPITKAQPTPSDRGE